MPIINQLKYSYNDVSIVPTFISHIKSRSECNPTRLGKLPIFASPMATITNDTNFEFWNKSLVEPILPRNVGDTSSELNRIKSIKQYIEDGKWVALSLNEFELLFVKENGIDILESEYSPYITYRICVDLANGHMLSLYDTITEAKRLSKERGYELIVMTGNIANPETYSYICRFADVDYIRVSIGSGFNCITSTQTGIHYPIASLIDEIYKIKQFAIKEFEQHGNNLIRCVPKIVADGGVRNYSDVVKALALGADYVMCGSIFTGLLESAAPVIDKDGDIVEYLDLHNVINKPEYYKRGLQFEQLYKVTYGMSTKIAQQLINPNSKRTKTSEGCIKTVNVSGTLNQWTENMYDYIRSAMSYTSKKKLDDFIGKVDLVINSNNTVNSINK